MASSIELFMEEDEMASWLYHPLCCGGGGGDDIDPGGIRDVGGSDFPEQPQGGAPAAMASPEQGCREVEGWAASGKPRAVLLRGEEAAGSRESTVVGSSLTPELAAGPSDPGRLRVSADDGREEETGAWEQGPASSSWVSCGGEAASRGDGRKRRAREEDDNSDSHSEDDAEFESTGKRRDPRRSTSLKRPRAAEVHNLSERRRRDRINEKMKALQQLIPRCNKTDKASMLDDAIEYMKSLQMQVRMMSMGYNMAPLMFPGVQQCMPSLGMGVPMGMSMGMGLGMGMDMTSGGLSRPMVPFPAVLMPGAQIATMGAAHMSQRLPLQPFHAPAAALSDQMTLQATGQTEPVSVSARIRIPSTVPTPNPAGYHQVHPKNGKITEPGSSRGANMPEKS